MFKLNFTVLLALFSLGTSLAEAKKYYAGNLPPVKIFRVNNVKELLNGGPLNLNRAKLITNNQNYANKFEANNKTIVETNNNHQESSVSDDSVELNENTDSNKLLFAVGSNFSNLAVLVPANLSVLQKSNIHPQHIIGYVPLKTPNGEAIVLPAGAVRVFNTLKNERHILNNNEIKTYDIDKENMKTRAASEVEEDSKPEGREVIKRKNIRRRNLNGRLRRKNRRRYNNSNNHDRRRHYSEKMLRRKHSNRNKKRRKSNKRNRSTKKRKISIN